MTPIKSVFIAEIVLFSSFLLKHPSLSFGFGFGFETQVLALVSMQ